MDGPRVRRMSSKDSNENRRTSLAPRDQNQNHVNGIGLKEDPKLKQKPKPEVRYQIHL